MKCSDCTNVIKPVVAIDIDGTLGDYHWHFNQFASLYLGKHFSFLNRKGYDGRQPMREWFAEVTETDVRTFREIKLAYRQGGQKRSMPVYQNAVELVTSCREAGAEVWLTTTRPYLRLDNVDPDTRFWLEQHGIQYDGLLYDEDKYAVLRERIDPARVVAILDDLPEQVREAGKQFGHSLAILRCHQYNMAHWHAFDWTIHQLSEAQERVLLRIENWFA